MPSLATVSYDKTSTVKLGPIEYSVSVSAFLNASGIYPYAVGQDFDEWTEEGLDALIEQFNEAQPANSLSNLSSFRVIQNTVNRVIAYPKEAWNRLRAFANWLISNFSLTDNQEGVEIGIYSSDYMPVYSETPTFQQLSASDYWIFIPSKGYTLYFASNASAVAALFLPAPNYTQYYLYVGTLQPNKYYFTNLYSSGAVDGLRLNTVKYYNDVPVYVSSVITLSVSDLPQASFSKIPVLETQTDFLRYVATGNVTAFSGVIADTSTVSVPPELPADTEYGGLLVAPSVEMAESSETDLSVPTDITTVIEAGVENHNRPIVTPVGVVLAPDVVINPDTGELTPTEVEIDFSNIPLSPSQYALPGLYTLFPFSIPWDIASTLSALNAAPVRPEFEVSLYVPFTENPVPFTIGFSEEVAPSVDAFMTKFRAMLLVLMCVGFLWFVFQFLVPR